MARILPVAVWVVVLTLLAGQGWGQSYKIVDIRVTGIVRASEAMIKNVAAMQIGEELTGTILQDAVKNLYAKGIFKDIAVDVEQAPAGVIVTIAVREYPQLSSVTFKGNKKLSEKNLNELIKLAPGGYITDHLIIQSRSRIENEYMGKGYFLAQAVPTLDFTPDSAQAALVFTIKEYDKVKVERVVLTGNSQLPAKKVIGKMSNRKRGLLWSSDFKKEKYPEDKEKVIAYCRDKGFVDAYIVSDSFVVDTTRNRMTIYIELYEGPKYYFGNASFAGNTIYDPELLTGTLKYKPGDVYNEEKYDESMAELYGVYHEKGYLHARVFDARRTRDSTIDIEYDITEGLPSQIRLIDIAGNTKTKEKVIRRELMMRPGETFRRSAMMRSLRQVMQLNYFSDVVPDVRDLPSGDVDLIVKVTEKPTGQVSAGAGYSGQDKLVGTFGLGIPNFRGSGQDVSINVDFGSRRNSISLGFTEPWFLGTPTSVGGDVYSLNRRWYDDFTEGRRGAAVRLGRRLKWPDNYFRVFWSYRLEDVRYFDFSSLYLMQNGDSVVNSGGQPVYIPAETSLQQFGERWMRTSAMSFTVERDSRDLPIFATDGARISYTGEYAGGLLGGNWEYYKHLFNAQRYIPVGWGMALAAKLRFGYISAASNEKVPYSERFTPGGTDPDGIVRGYSEAALAPRNSKGALLGGIAEVIYNLELQVPILKGQMYGLVFADAGNAWRGKSEIRPLTDLYTGAGFGFRLVVPGVGVIGFDYGYGFDTIHGEKPGWKPHFQIGQEF
jgi:outer membrane protein insertion porin family